MPCGLGASLSGLLIRSDAIPWGKVRTRCPLLIRVAGFSPLCSYPHQVIDPTSQCLILRKFIVDAEAPASQLRGMLSATVILIRDPSVTWIR